MGAEAAVAPGDRLAYGGGMKQIRYVFVALVLLFALAACGDGGGLEADIPTTTAAAEEDTITTGGDADTTTTEEAEGVEGDLTSVFELEVGDCFDDPASGDSVEEVEVLDCDDPHDNEIFFLFDVDGDEFPGESGIKNQAQDRCTDEFETYVGTSLDESELDADALLVPTEGSWEQGDREVVCAAWNADLSKLDSSVEDSDL
ncbi:MAG: septum formation family protein [Acidimicrobiales bacterium]